MSNRELVRGSNLFNAELSGSIASVKLLEAVHGDTGRSGDELQQPGLLFAVKFCHRLPEPLDDLFIRSVLAVLGVGLPVLHIDLGDSSNEELKLAGVKDFNQVLGNDLKESLSEGLQLLLDSLDNTEFGNQSVQEETNNNRSNMNAWEGGFFFSFKWGLPGIFLLVLVGHRNVSAVRDQVKGGHLAELLLIDGESHIKNIGDVIVPVSRRMGISNEESTTYERKKDREKTHSIHCKLLWKSASTLSMSTTVTAFSRIILYMGPMKKTG